MKCSTRSSTTHDILISEEIRYKSYKEICKEEPKKVNIGYFGDEVENNLLLIMPRTVDDNIYGIYSHMPLYWEFLTKFFSIHNIKPKWLDCNFSAGRYNEKLGRWTGCLGKV